MAEILESIAECPEEIELTKATMASVKVFERLTALESRALEEMREDGGYGPTRRRSSLPD
jgi:hypothetical protein